MKHCNTCNRDLDLSRFSKNKQKPDGFQTVCKECRKIYWDKHYKENKSYYVERAKSQKKELREYYREFKANSKCLFCGESDPCCLDFHHKDPNVKDFNLSTGHLTKGIKKMIAEMDKCVVLCANCHRKLHAGRLTLPSAP